MRPRGAPQGLLLIRVYPAEIKPQDFSQHEIYYGLLANLSNTKDIHHLCSGWPCVIARKYLGYPRVLGNKTFITMDSERGGGAKALSPTDWNSWGETQIIWQQGNMGLMERLDQGYLRPVLEHTETNMSRPGIEQASQASTLAKSYSNSLLNCYSEPLHGLLFTPTTRIMIQGPARSAASS